MPSERKRKLPCGIVLILSLLDEDETTWKRGKQENGPEKKVVLIPS
jgi:hypothetical protein